MAVFVWGWERGISPFSFLRGMGPFGPMFAGKYSLRRFGSQSEEDVRDIHAYIYNTSMLKGSGEYCISHILAPGAYARIPIVDRIGALKVPVTFICELFLPILVPEEGPGRLSRALRDVKLTDRRRQ
jgi:cardiolipin-specific phospholipase